MKNKIAVGTANFGMTYGIGVESHRVAENEVARLIEYCVNQKLAMFDTAPGYGESEQVLGRICLGGSYIVTKMVKLERNEVSDDCIARLENGLQNSLRKLRVSSVYGLLVHSVADLYKPGAERIVSWMSGLKERGLVNKIGVSVYTQEEVDDLYNKKCIFDLIQLPLNIFDQRLLISGTLDWLREKGVEIHARSLFMKGLLLKEEFPPINAPLLHDHHQRFISYLSNLSVDAFDVCMAFAKSLDVVDRWVLGFSQVEQLRRVIQWDDDVSGEKICFEDWALTSSTSVDPRCWR
ncbi:MAG: hypothetical protein GKR95_13940 [Gammaproteobacteria bacterium]|nr:hypothetical protein [Gammaproteobacteria bacterium]